MTNQGGHDPKYIVYRLRAEEQKPTRLRLTPEQIERLRNREYAHPFACGIHATNECTCGANELADLRNELFLEIDALRDMVVSGADGRHWRLEELPIGEPYFLIRGQDEFAYRTVLFYGDQLAAAGYNNTSVDHVLQHAQEIMDWPVKKRPD